MSENKRHRIATNFFHKGPPPPQLLKEHDFVRAASKGNKGNFWDARIVRANPWGTYDVRFAETGEREMDVKPCNILYEGRTPATPRPAPAPDGMMVLNSAPAQPPARAKTKVVTAAADGAASGAALAAGVWAADSAQHGPHSVDGRQLFCHLGVDSMQLLPPPAGDENDMSRRMLFTMRYIPTEGADESTADSAGPACSESDSD